jgi:hypothetical protein
VLSRLQSVEHREPSVHCAHRQQNNMHGLLADRAGKVGWQLLFDMCVEPIYLCCAGGQNESFMRLQAICRQEIDEMTARCLKASSDNFLGLVDIVDILEVLADNTRTGERKANLLTLSSSVSSSRLHARRSTIIQASHP